MAKRRWRKIWRDLWDDDSDSLGELKGIDLYVFVVLLVHADWEPGDDVGVYRQKDRLPRRCRLRADHVQKSVQKLHQCCAIRDSGDHIEIPNFARWQDSKWAKYKREDTKEAPTESWKLVGVSLESPSASASSSSSLHEGTVSERAHLASYAKKGDDPDGLGPWPDTLDEQGVRVRRLAYTAKAAERLGEGYTAIELHRMVHDLARMVAEGSFPASDYRSEYVFSGFLSKTMQAVEQWRAGIQTTKRKRYDPMADMPSV